MKKKEETTGEGQATDVKPEEDKALEDKNIDHNAAGSSTDSNEPQVMEITLKGVVLKGTDSQKIGPHTLFMGSRIVNFVDGKANVQEDLAKELEDGGYIE